MPTDLWLSIHPTWTRKILAGEKTVELRRTRPKFAEGRAVIYSTAPVSSAVAIAEVGSVSEMALEELWSEFGARAAISRDEFDDYFAGQSVGTAIVLSSVSEFARAVRYEQIERMTGVKPAQGWRYLEPAVVVSLLKTASRSSA